MSYENTSLTTNLDQRGGGGGGGGENTGAVAFSGVLLIMVGLFHALQGIVALANDDIYAVTKNYVFKFDFTTWGWIHLILGILVAGAGAGLFFGKTWARTVAVIAAAVSMLGSFMWLPHYPVWSLVIMALDVFVMWAAIVHGRALVEE
jgi:hypothetical protein